MSQDSAISNKDEQESLLINNENNNIIITSPTLDENNIRRYQPLSYFKTCRNFTRKHSKWFILTFILITLYCLAIYILTLIGMAELVRCIDMLFIYNINS